MLDFAQFGLATNLGVFAIAAAAVWMAGTRIASYADAISEKTGLSHALLGLVLLAGVTSLPEAAVSVSSAWSGNASLAVNNLLGGVAMQVTFLAIADFLIGVKALTSVVPNPVVMLQGSLNIVLLSIAAVGAVVGDVPVLGVGLWVWLILTFGGFSFWLMSQSEGRRPWVPNVRHEDSISAPAREEAKEGSADSPSADSDIGLSLLLGKTAIAGSVILVAGFLVSRTGDSIAGQTGLGASFTGLVLLAFATSLPEISTVTGAVRLGRYTMAISDILGTTIFNLLLLFAIDAVAADDAVLNRVGTFSAVGAILCIVVTALYLAGLAERRDRTFARLGIDSIAVLIAYVGGLALLYTLR